MREIRTLRATWRGLETWNGRNTGPTGAPVLDPTCATRAAHRGFQIVKEHGDAGISGGKGRDKCPAFGSVSDRAICVGWSEAAVPAVKPLPEFGAH